MPDGWYVATAVALAVLVTVTLRATPFVARRAVGESPLVLDLGRWMPLGVVVILACYGVSHIDVTSVGTALGPILGSVATVGVHLRWRSTLVSMVSGTTICVVISTLW